MEKLRPSSGPTMGVLTFGGREPAQQQLVFSFTLSQGTTYQGLDSLNGGTSGLRDLSETCALRKAKLVTVFLANYPLEQREDL
jgi:hypothetical protein